MKNVNYSSYIQNFYQLPIKYILEYTNLKTFIDRFHIEYYRNYILGYNRFRTKKTSIYLPCDVWELLQSISHGKSMNRTLNEIIVKYLDNSQYLEYSKN